MPGQPTKQATEAVGCGVNHYVDVSFGTAHGAWHASEREAQADKRSVEGSAEQDAWVHAQQEAVAVADRECPERCRPKRAQGGDPPPIEPTYRAADVYESAPESESGSGWRWHAKAKMEWEVLFVCGE